MSRWLPSRVEISIAGGADSSVIAFERDLDTRALRRGTRLLCVVGGEAVRYAVVPWVEAMSSPELGQRLAEQCFRETYGEVAREWRVCRHAGGFGSATLACAIDSSLLGHLDAAARARGLSIVSVQPSLMHAFNQTRRAIDQGLFWFVAFEPLWTTLLLMSDAEPLLVKRMPTSSVALIGVLDREWFSLGIDAEPCPVYMVRSAQVPALTAPWRGAVSAKWRFIDLSPAPESAVESSALKAA